MTNGSLICLSGIAEGKHYQKTFGEAKEFTTSMLVLILVSVIMIN